MRIENEVLLNFSDILLKPKRSTLASRNDVDLTREYRFKYGLESWTGIGIIAANMDNVGTISMARSLSKYKILTALHKHYDAEILVKFFSEELDDAHNCFYSLGITDKDLEKFNYVKEKLKNIDGRNYISKICIDVANAYSENFVNFLKKFRNDNPDSIIMAGNVATGEMTEELVLSGADVVKVGIGPGCFLPKSIVITKTGLKYIECVKIGDEIKTHLGNFQKVTHIFKYDNNNDEIIYINNIGSTKKHEYYVINKKYKNIINDDNIHVYAEWISAEHLNSNYLLIKHK